jgi:hypothetical protein
LAREMKSPTPQHKPHVAVTNEPSGSRNSDSWAAYGRFVYAAVRTRSSHRVVSLQDGLRLFQRRFLKLDTSTVYAWQKRDAGGSGWNEVMDAVTTIASRVGFDLLTLYLGGTLPEGVEGGQLIHLAGGKYVALTVPHDTRDVIELAPRFEDFLQTLSRNNRKNMRARLRQAGDQGLLFGISSDPNELLTDEHFALGLQSRPVPYRRELVEAFEAYSLARPYRYHATLRKQSGDLLSYASGFIEQDTALLFYQFNHNAYPDLGLSMMMRAFLIRHWIESGATRAVFPMGLNGHLSHVAAAYPVIQLTVLRRAPIAVMKALVMRLCVPTSDAALLVKTSRSFRHLLTRAREPLS